MSQTASADAAVIRSALQTHLAYLRTAESAHRSAGRALSGHPDLPVSAGGQNPITLSAAHRARCASYGQRAEFVEQLNAFPAAGLMTLSAHDMRSLQVPAHIGGAAVPPEVAARIAQRENQARAAAARPAARPASDRASVGQEQAGGQDAPPQTGQHPRAPKPKTPWPKRSFNDILFGRR